MQYDEEILNEREDQYGSPEANLSCAASLINTYLEYRDTNEIEARDVAMIMILVKIARATCGDPTIVDHYVDIKGYAELAWELTNGDKRDSAGVIKVDSVVGWDGNGSVIYEACKDK